MCSCPFSCTIVHEVVKMLEKYAKPRKRGDTATITARVPKEVLERFREHCRRLNLTPSEAVAILIEKELEEAGK